MDLSSSEHGFVSKPLSNLEHPDPQLYREEDDENQVVAVRYAASPERASSSSAPNAEKSPTLNDELLDMEFALSVAMEDSIGDECAEESSEAPNEPNMDHTKWYETCATLRHLGTFARLPEEVQVSILELCGPTSLLRLRQTCPYGGLVGMQDRFWKKLFETDFEGAEIEPEEHGSWMSLYQGAYSQYARGEARSTRFPPTCWKYAFGRMWRSTEPSRCWTFNTSSNIVRSPTFKTFSWNPTDNRLHGWNFAAYFNPTTLRFTSTSPMAHASILSQTAYPPKMYIQKSGAEFLGWHLTGRIPIPLLIIMIFAPDE